MARGVSEMIKESTENKINAKTTWQSTLIDEFSDVGRFTEKHTNGTNFQHASIVLDGCVKVYSTRVDSVVDEAGKLMESVGRAKDVKKEEARREEKKQHTAEADLESLQIRKKHATPDDEILEHLARESKEGDTRGLLIHLLRWNDRTGLTVLQSAQATQDAPKDAPTQMGVPGVGAELQNQLSQISPYDHTALLPSSADRLSHLGKSLLKNEQEGAGYKSISPMFADFSPDMSLDKLPLPTYAFHISYENTPSSLNYAQDAAEEVGYESSSDNEEAGDLGAREEHLKRKEVREERGVSREELRLSINPFGYFKGWAGPAHWKVQQRRKPPKKKEKERRRAEIDFLSAAHMPISQLFERDERSVLTPQQIVERRRNTHTLPQDYSVKAEDLYRMFLHPGHLYRSSKNEDEDNVRRTEDNTDRTEDAADGSENGEGCGEAGAGDAAPVMAWEEREREYGQEASQSVAQESSLLTRRLLQSTLRKIQRNDIVQIKNQLWNEIEKGERRVEEMYSAVKEKEVSVQFCFVSLLHLANEKQFCLSSEPGSALSKISELRVSKDVE